MSEVQQAPQQPQAAPAAQPEAVAPQEVVQQPQPAEGQQAEQQGTEAPKQEGEKEGEEKHRSRAYRRLDRWRQRAIEAETREKVLREQYERPAPQQQQQPAQAQPADDGSPKREQFSTYEDFIEAKATWRADKAADARTRQILEESEKSKTQRSQQEAQEKQDREFRAHIEAARDAIEDFDDVLQDSDATLTEAMRAAILESGDKGPFIGYHLAKNPEEAARIAKLSPTRQAAEIVKLEEKVTKPVKAPSKAPAPISTVGKTTDAATHLDTTKPEAAKHLSTAEWIKRDMERMAKHGIRG